MSSVTVEKAHPPFVIGIDIGTSNVRAVVFDRLGYQVAGLNAHRGQALRTTAQGAAELEPDRVLDLAWQCLDEVHAGIRARGLRVSAVGLCSLVGNVLGVDKRFRPLTPVYTYADTRGKEDADWLSTNLDEESVRQRTGCPFHPAYLPVRLRWLKRTDPGTFRTVARWISIGEYLEWHAFGETAVSCSVASWSGLLDRHRCDWDGPLLECIGLGRAKLSPVNRGAEPREGLAGRCARRWPLLKTVPWFPAIGDGAAANIGTGCVSEKRAALTVGTTSAVRVVVEGSVPTIPKGLWCYLVDRRRSLPGGALSEGGNVAVWLRETFGLGDARALDAARAAVGPDAHGLTVLPLLAGERSPGWSEGARGGLYGLRLSTTPLDIVRAFSEAIAYRIASVLELLESIVPSKVEVIAAGGAVKDSPVWLQIIADVLGRPVTVSEVGEPSARGAALFALERQGLLAGLEEAPVFPGRVFVPDESLHSVYREARLRQQEFYKRLVATPL